MPSGLAFGRGMAGDVLEARVLEPEFVGAVFVDGNRGGNIPELIAHQHSLTISPSESIAFGHGQQGGFRT